jgi:cytochrome c-type biogenesis protein CcmH/NrfG
MKSSRVVLLAAFLILAVSSVWGEKVDKPRFHSSTYKMTAKVNLKNEYRMYDSAAVILEEGIRFFPGDAEMHFLLGKTYSYLQNYRGMAEQFAVAESIHAAEGGKDKWMEELEAIRKEKWPQIFNQGVAAHNEQELDKSLDLFITSTILNPKDYRGFLRTGYAYALKGDNQNAVVYMEKGARLAPENPDMLRGYADVLFFSGQGQEALTIYKKILEKNPDDVEVLKDVASIYSASNDFEQALTYLEKAVKVDPEYKDGQFNVGEIYRQKINQVIDTLGALKDEAGEYRKDQESTAKVEELLKRKQEYLASAQSSYRQVLAIDTSDVEAMDRLAEIYQEEEDFDQALVMLRNVVERDSTNCKAWQQLAFIYAKRNMGDEAKNAYQKAQDCAKTQP